MDKVTDSSKWPEVVILHPVEVAEALSYFLFEIGALGLEQNPGAPGIDQMTSRADFRPGSDPEELSQKLSEFLEELAGIFGLPTPPEAQWRMETTGDWTEKWKEGLTPIEIGSTLVIKPSWCDYKVQPGQRIMEIDPGMAFGTGRHASTYMCLEIIENLFGSPAGDRRVLDVGTGSGILAMACGLLGQDHIVAIDIDPSALPVAAENLVRNGMERAVDLACAEPRALKGAFDVILANLTALDLIQLSRELARLASGRATMILSGILTEQAPDVMSVFQDLGFSVSERREQEEWTALVLEKDPR